MILYWCKSSESSSIVALPFLSSLVPLALKLDRSNFAYSLILPTIRPHDLEGCLLGSHPCPPQFLQADEGSSNQASMSYASATQSSSSFVLVPCLIPEYSIWICTDQALMSWLIFCNFDFSFNRSKRAGDLSINDYFLKVRAIAENLAAAGQVLTDEDLLLFILGSLGSKYDPVIINLPSRLETISLPEAQFMLQNQEMRIDQAHSISLPDPHFANLAQKNRSRSGFSNNGGSTSGHYHNDGCGNRGPRGCGGRGCGDHHPVCQIYGRVGHLASRCYSHFDPYMSLDTAASQSPQQPGSSSIPSAYVASSTTINDPSLYIDSGAIDHITSDLTNLALSLDYKGEDKIPVGNGNNLSISHNLGIAFRHPHPHGHAQNSKVERKLPTPVLHDKSPFEMVYHKEPDYQPSTTVTHGTNAAPEVTSELTISSSHSGAPE
ncbi:hypothetical protein PanWU01x14_201710 [Parasponia andersonii]|uniref:Retrovirus-related Pol polyprotein from transposon TNT 1-94 n=1 Tax=Parasponia andersonii TaxID=3476 RepID=A0A2P5BXF2_PARAD|nr:hypothetical protein PanWU01x14_201710 [Parasponia andersonii]